MRCLLVTTPASHRGRDRFHPAAALVRAGFQHKFGLASSPQPVRLHPDSAVHRHGDVFGTPIPPFALARAAVSRAGLFLAATLGGVTWYRHAVH